MSDDQHSILFTDNNNIEKSGNEECSKQEYEENQSQEDTGTLEETLEAIRNAKKKLDITSSTKEELVKKCKDLKYIMEYLDEQKKLKKCPPDLIFGELIEMVSANLFRQLPQKVKGKCPDAIEDEKEAAEPLWDQMNMVYTILQRTILLEGNVTSLRIHINERFLQHLMEIFDSPDFREREKLKVVVHRAYLKMYIWRPYFRKKIAEILLRHVFADQTRGIDQLLQVYGCIVSGFSLPLRAEHIRFLKKVLLPLHKAEDFEEYHKFLTYCLVQFLYLDESLTDPIISGLIKYWPKTNSAKEVLFLQEVGQFFQVMLPEQFGLVAEKLFKQITNSMISPNAQVATAAFMLWKNQRALTMIAMFHEKIMPVVFPALYSMRREHWNPGVTTHIYALFKSLLLMNRGLFDELVMLCNTSLDIFSKDSDKREKQKVRFSNSLSYKEISTYSQQESTYQ